MSGSPTMSKNIGILKIYELVSEEVVEKIGNSDDELEITPGGTQEEPEPRELDSNSTSELEKLCSSVYDEIDIKHEVNHVVHNSSSDLDAGSSKIDSISPTLESMNPEETELNQLYLDLLQCERDCDTCQKYIQKLREHVRTTHAADQPTCDPLHIDPLDTDTSTAIEIKCEVDEDVERMDCSVEPDSHPESDPISEVETGSDSDPDYSTSPDLKRKLKSGRMVGKNHKRVKSSRKDEIVSQTNIPKSKRTFKCEECGKIFSRKIYLSYHLKIHTGQNLVECGQCGKSFTSKRYLTVHMMSHTGQKPFKCEECGNSYKTKGHLTVHRMIHTGERPYDCEECGKCFTTSSLLKRHRMIHNEEKTIKCSLCDKGFKYRDNLYSHMKTHCHKNR